MQKGTVGVKRTLWDLWGKQSWVESKPGKGSVNNAIKRRSLTSII